MLYHGEWGTVCDLGWSHLDATLVCQYLGYASGEARHAAVYGEGTGVIWMEGGECKQQHKRFIDCYPRKWGNTNCQHSSDAGVVCSYSGSIILILSFRH